MMDVALRNRQRTRRLDCVALERLTRILLQDLLRLETCQLGIHLVGRPAIERLNRRFLNQAGPTDVLTFDHADLVEHRHLYGEIFLCLDVIVAQAKTYRARWPAELARCLIHGLLHLQGFDDRQPHDRRRMKHRENRLLHTLAQRFDLRQLARCR